MSDPFSGLQPRVRAALTAHGPLTALVGQRIYDRVPDNAEKPDGAPDGWPFPYLTIDVTDAISDDDDCGRHWVFTVQVHVWSRAAGRQEASLIVGPVRAALDAMTAPAGHEFNWNQFRITRMMTDRDGLTTHAIVEQEIGLAALA